MVLDEVAVGDTKDLPCENGRLNFQRASGGKNMANAMKEGMTWHVFPYWVEEAYPAIPLIFQSACNQEGQVQEGEGWPQMLLKIQAKATELKAECPIVNKDKLIKAVLRSQPPRADDVPDQVAFSQKWSGGSSGVFTKAIVDFCKVMAIPPTHHVPARYFKALGALDFGVEAQPGIAVNAVLKRIAASKSIVDGCAQYVTASSVPALASKKKNMLLEANAVVGRFQQVLATSNLSATDQIRYGSLLEMACVDVVFQAETIDGHKFKTFEEAVIFYMERCFGKPATPEQKQNEQNQVEVSNVIEFDQSGRAMGVGKNHAAQKGFRAHVVITGVKGDPFKSDKWEILEITEDGSAHVQLLDAFGKRVAPQLDSTGDVVVGDPALKTLTVDELCLQHKVYTKQTKLMEGYPGSEGKYDNFTEREVMVGRMRDCMLALAKSIPDQPVRVHEKPHKGVFATKAIPVGELLLVPCSRSLAPHDPKKVTNPRSVKCTLLGAGNDEPQDMVLQPAGATPEYCVAYWCVQEADKDDGVNLKHVGRDIQFLPPTTKEKVTAAAGAIHHAKIPCFVNTRDIAEGEELFRAKIKKPEMTPRIKLNLDAAPLKNAKLA